MRHPSRTATALAALSLAALFAGACNQQPSVAMQARLDSLTTAAQERDRLMQDMADNARFLSEVSTELSKVQMTGRRLRVSSESPLAASRDSVIQKIRYVTTRLGETESRLRQSQRRVGELATLSDSLRTTLEATLANYQGMVEDQRATIAALSEQVGLLETETVALRDTVANLSAMTNTVYWIAGTKEELLEQGIAVEEGGARVLFVFGRAGKTLAPARDLDPTLFHAINKRDVRTIPFPDSAATYRIASRQDLDHLVTPPDERGQLRGHLEIAAPEQFWANSKFLILVRAS
jgi:hypothetical protein